MHLQYDFVQTEFFRSVYLLVLKLVLKFNCISLIIQIVMVFKKDIYIWIIYRLEQERNLETFNEAYIHLVL